MVRNKHQIDKFLFLTEALDFCETDLEKMNSRYRNTTNARSQAKIELPEINVKRRPCGKSKMKINRSHDAKEYQKRLKAIQSTYSSNNIHLEKLN